MDGDGNGDLCDADADGDLVPNVDDACPLVANRFSSEVTLIELDGDDFSNGSDRPTLLWGGGTDGAVVVGERVRIVGRVGTFDDQTSSCGFAFSGHRAMRFSPLQSSQARSHWRLLGRVACGWTTGTHGDQPLLHIRAQRPQTQGRASHMS